MTAYVPSYSFVNPVYKPAMRVIAGITQAPQATVTTTVNHGYIVGTIVRIDIVPTGGMEQINQQTGTILTVPSPTTFTININTTLYDAFTIPSSFPPPYNDSQVVPIGEDASILTAAVVNALNPT